jgi:hypothetical protein
MLSSDSRDQFCGSPVVLLWSWVLVFGVLVDWALFLSLTTFLWFKVSDLSASLLLSACCDGLLIVFQFCNVI